MKMKNCNHLSTLTKWSLILICLCMVGCHVPHEYQLRRITWDETTRLLMIGNSYTFVTTSRVRIDTLPGGILDLKLKFASLFIDNRWAVDSAIEVPPGLTAIKLNGMVIPLSELRVETAIENDKRVEEIILRPRLYPSTFKFKYYHVKKEWW